MSAGVVGHSSSMGRSIDAEFMTDVRSSDHVVMDTPNLDGYKCRYMAKANGMKI